MERRTSSWLRGAVVLVGAAVLYIIALESGGVRPSQSPSWHSAASITVAAATADARTQAAADFVCDGRSDQVEIQAAIDSLPGRGDCHGGGTVLLTGGDFRIDAPIRVRGGLILRGAGGPAGTAIRVAAGSNCHILTYDGTQRTYFLRIQDLCLIGDAKYSVMGDGIHVPVTTLMDVSLSHVFISSCAGNGIDTASLWGWNLNNVVIEFCKGTGFAARTPAGSQQGPRILNSKFLDNLGGAVLLESQVRQALIMASDFHCNVPGMKVLDIEGGSGHIIQGCRFGEGAADAHIFLAPGVESTTIVGNSFRSGRNSPPCSIQFSAGAKANVVTGNTFALKLPTVFLRDADGSNVVSGNAGTYK